MDALEKKQRKAKRKAIRQRNKAIRLQNKASKPEKSQYAQDSDKFYRSRAWKELRYTALRNSDGRCCCCGAGAKDGAILHVDHILPRLRYRSLELELSNLQILCGDCNMGKSYYYNDDWRVKMES